VKNPYGGKGTAATEAANTPADGACADAPHGVDSARACDAWLGPDINQDQGDSAKAPHRVRRRTRRRAPSV